jgi:AcrR family transcriptional regulator
MRTVPAKRIDGIKRREALLDAALACFDERGVLGVGIEEIRKVAGASPSSVYNLFDGFSGLVLALLERTFERLFADLATKVCATRSARSAVLTLVEAHLDWVLAHRREARFLYQATALEYEPAARDALMQRKSEMLAPLVAHLIPFVEAGELPRWSPTILDLVVLGPTHEACRRILAGADIDPVWIRKNLPKLAWNSVSAER